MKATTSFGILLSLLSQSACVLADLTSDSHGNMRGQAKQEKSRYLTTGMLECRLWMNCLQFLPDEATDTEEPSAHEWVCSFSDPSIAAAFGDYQDRKILGVGVAEYLVANGAESGNTILVLSQANIYEEVVEIDLENVIGLEPYETTESDADTIETRRKLAPSTGTLNTLVVRVNALDSVPNSAAALSSDVFNDPVCLKSQTGACSYGKMDIQEYIPGNGISNVATSAPGVVDVFVNRYTSNTNYFTMQAHANTELRTMFGVSNPGTLFDLVLFCMPPGMGSWLAYAYIGRWDSYYNGVWCQRVSAQMHEVGHNIRLHHSGEYTGGSTNQEYGDLSGYMGYSYSGDDTPAMCFNAAKNWQLGWYTDKQIEIDPTTDLCTTPISFLLNGIVDYQNASPGAYIIIKVGAYFYLGFNKGTGFNVGTNEVKDQVTVHRKLGSPSSATFSKLQDGLDVGEYENMAISASLTVRVRYVSNVNYKDAVIELSAFGTDANPNCPSAPTLPPTPAPVHPTAPPTDHPTNPPTAHPTPAPIPPTLPPTPPPTQPPTFPPTFPPTNPPPPTHPPTHHPTYSPTLKPTGLPTPTPVGWQCTAANMLPAPKACGPGIKAGYYPDLTDPRSYCFCTGTDAPGQYTTCTAPLIWNPFPGGVGQYISGTCPTIPCGQNGLWGTQQGACDWAPAPTNPPTPPPTLPPTLPPVPPPPTHPPTNHPTAGPQAWSCIKANFPGGVGQCPGMKAGYYPDLTRKNAYCYCTGTAAPSRYEKCTNPLKWDSFLNNWGTYLGGNHASGTPYGKFGYWGTNQGTCTWATAVSNKTKQRPPY